jgi:hypothetical protein
VANLMIVGGRCAHDDTRNVGIERQSGPAVAGKSTRPVVLWSPIGAVCAHSSRLGWRPPPGKTKVHGGAPRAYGHPIPAAGLSHLIPPGDAPAPVLRRPNRGRSAGP